MVPNWAVLWRRLTSCSASALMLWLTRWRSESLRAALAVPVGGMVVGAVAVHAICIDGRLNESFWRTTRACRTRYVG